MSHSHIPLYNIFSIVIEENQDLEIMISYGKHLDMFSHDLLSANVYVNSSGIDDISTMIMSLGKMYWVRLTIPDTVVSFFIVTYVYNGYTQVTTHELWGGVGLLMCMQRFRPRPISFR